MTSQDIIDVLKAVPEKRLRLVELAWEIVGPDGKPDSEKSMFLAEEITLAIEEAEAYAQATRRVVFTLKRLMR